MATYPRSPEAGVRFLELIRLLGVTRYALAARATGGDKPAWRALEQRMRRMEGVDENAQGRGGMLYPSRQVEDLVRRFGVLNAPEVVAWLAKGATRPALALTPEAFEHALPEAATAAVVTAQPQAASAHFLATGTGGMVSVGGDASRLVLYVQAKGAAELLERARARRPDDPEVAGALAILRDAVLPGLGGTFDTKRAKHAAANRAATFRRGSPAKKIQGFEVLAGGRDLEAARRLGS